MSFTFKQNPDGTATVQAESASVNESVLVKFANSVDAEIGRGTTDAEITFIALRDSDGVKHFIYPHTDGSVTTSTSRP